MELHDILFDVRDRLGERADFDETDYDSQEVGNFWRNDFLVRKIRQANVQFNHEHKWSWMLREQAGLTLAAGTNEIELIDDVDLNRHAILTLSSTVDANDVIVLEKILPMQGAALAADTLLRGSPQYFYVHRHIENYYEEPEVDDADRVFAAIVRVLPVPLNDYTGTFTYYTNANPTMVYTDEPDCPAQYHQAIVALATAHAYGREQTQQGSNKAAEAMAEYFGWVERAKLAEKSTSESERIQIGGAPPDYRYSRGPRYPHLPPNVGL
jgi:hypothetical protein